jgi:hypothetical protein
MRDYRNPFKMRAAEKIESDSTFLRLYSPGVLEILLERHKADELWGHVGFIRSSPGGGKTSLLRLFTADSLKTIDNYRTNQYYAKLVKLLMGLGILSEDKIEIVGVLLSCARNYTILEDLPIEESLKNGLFFALLNSRIILSALKEIAKLQTNFNFPEDLKNIQYSNKNSETCPPDFPKNTDCLELYKWAESIEQRVYSEINGFAPIQSDNIVWHNELFSIDALGGECFSINKKSIIKHILIMFDDGHKLSENQRISLREYIIERRSGSSVWISERLEALRNHELWPSGALEGRDYFRIKLEDYWDQNINKFEKVIEDIADKRAKLSKDVQVDSFQDCLGPEIEEAEFSKKLDKILEKSLAEIQSKYSNQPRYSEWVKLAEDFKGPLLEKVLFVQKVGILISRDEGKSQLDLGFPLGKPELEYRDNNGVRLASRYFLSTKYDLPYYFGIQDLTRIAFSNIEQFLTFAGEVFEEILALNVIGEATIVSSSRQDQAMRNAADNRWKELPKIIPNGHEVCEFLEKFGFMARKESQSPNAPYAPGVNGIGLKSRFRNDLLHNNKYSKLMSILSTCVAFNLIKIEENKKQGKKGQTWNIFYLNRWLCLKFGLPLYEGNWRPKKLDEMKAWLS